MDQNVWWSTIALEGWANRPGARYHRLAAAIGDAAQRRLLVPGQRLPAERVLADLVGVSRGTVVRAFDELVADGLLERIQGSGTYLRARHSAAASTSNPGTDLEPDPRAGDADSDVLDLSRPGPGEPHDLPAYDPHFGPDTLTTGGQQHSAGLPALRHALAHFMSDVLAVPTTSEQIYVTSGSRQSLTMLWNGLGLAGRNVLVACPTWPDAVTAVGRRAGRVTPIRTDAFGTDVAAVQRLTRRTPEPVLLLSPTTGPTGIALAHPRRHRLAQTVEQSSALVVEDLSDLAYLPTPDGDGGSLSALSERIVAVGQLDQMLCSGLGIGWIRLPQQWIGGFRIPPHFRSPGVGAQLLAGRLLAAAGSTWLAGLRSRTALRRDYLIELLAEAIPAWSPQPAGHGPGVWVRLPVPEADSFAYTARRFGVDVGVGARYCLDGAHHNHIWLSAGRDDAVLELAVDSLSAAWHEYTHRVAATV